MLNDEKILLGILSGTPQERSNALTKICDSAYPKVESFLLAKGGNVEAAKDIFQDGVTIFYQNVMLKKFRQDSSIETYVFAICKNLWFQEINRQKKEEDGKKVVSTDDYLEKSETINIDLLKSVLGEVKNECRELLKLFYYQKKSIAEIKESIGLGSEQAVKNKKKRCLSYLMNIVKDRRLNKSSFFHE